MCLYLQYIYMYNKYIPKHPVVESYIWLFAAGGPFEGAVIAQDRGTGKSLVDTPEIQHISRLVFCHFLYEDIHGLLVGY